MSEPTLRPTWTPEDAAQTELDATGHTPSASVTGEPDPNPDMLPFRRPAGSTCECCGARPEESCETGCLNLMTDDEQRAHRDAAIDSVIAELALEESAPVVVDCPVVPPRPTGAHRRQTSRASHFAKMTLAVVVLVLVLVVGVLWAAARANVYDVPVSCSWTRAGGGCSGGYRKPVFDTGIETYVVTPETVLADEPGHIA